MTSISLRISLEVVHLTTTPLTHILFYRIEIDKLGQCSGTFTLGFLVLAVTLHANRLGVSLLFLVRETLSPGYTPAVT